jgi:hypothetical protein
MQGFIMGKWEVAISGIKDAVERSFPRDKERLKKGVSPEYGSECRELVDIVENAMRVRDRPDLTYALAFSLLMTLAMSLFIIYCAVSGNQ